MNFRNRGCGERFRVLETTLMQKEKH